MGASDRLAVCAATVLGDPLPASDDHGLLVHPSADFSAQALVSSPQQVHGVSLFFFRFPFRFC
jgi:acetyl-CoA synthetase